MKYNIVLAGVGGQGTVLASQLLAQAAMQLGETVRTAETIGMAQRGGCVVSHVRIGAQATSPLVPKGQADILLGFEPGEAVRCLPYLKPGGLVIAATQTIKPVTDSLGDSTYCVDAMLEFLQQQTQNPIFIDTDAICRELGSIKVLNVVLLGALCQSGVIPISFSNMETAIRQRVRERFWVLNQKALDAGRQAISKQQNNLAGGVSI